VSLKQNEKFGLVFVHPSKGIADDSGSSLYRRDGSHHHWGDHVRRHDAGTPSEQRPRVRVGISPRVRVPGNRLHDFSNPANCVTCLDFTI
jgi:hypothetical protein